MGLVVVMAVQLPVMMVVTPRLLTAISFLYMLLVVEKEANTRTGRKIYAMQATEAQSK